MALLLLLLLPTIQPHFKSLKTTAASSLLLLVVYVVRKLLEISNDFFFFLLPLYADSFLPFAALLLLMIGVSMESILKKIRLNYWWNGHPKSGYQVPVISWRYGLKKASWTRLFFIFCEIFCRPCLMRFQSGALWNLEKSSTMAKIG